MAGIKVFLVEDDWIIAKEISYTLQDLGFEVAGTCETGEDALKQIKNISPDIVLLDIQLSSEMTGIDVGRKLKEEKVPFIFLTALADRETIDKAKLVEPHGYLVKPVTRESIYSTIEITLHRAAKKEIETPATAQMLQENLTIDDGIFVKTNKRLEKILLRDVLYIEAHDIYAMIHTAAGKYLLNTSLKVVEEKFPSLKFIRCHRSYIINLDKVQAIEETDLLINDIKIPIGKTYRDKLLSRLSFF